MGTHQTVTKRSSENNVLSITHDFEICNSLYTLSTAIFLPFYEKSCGVNSKGLCFLVYFALIYRERSVRP